MKAPKSLLIITVLAVLLLGLSLVASDTYSFIAPPTVVPVEFGTGTENHFDGRYWVGTAQITGDDTKYKLVPEGMSYSDSIVVDITGVETTWSRPTEVDASPIHFGVIESHWYGATLGVEKVPYYNTASTEQELASSAKITITSPNTATKTYSISNYDTDSIRAIDLKDKDGVTRTAYFKVQGVTIANQYLPPGGDLSVVETDVAGQYSLVTFDNLFSAVYAWNARGYGILDDSYDRNDPWGSAYKWMMSQGKLPDRTPSVAKSVDIGGGKVKVVYPTSVFAPVVTFYIPAELAEYIVLVEQQPEFRFDSIEKIDGALGQSTRLKVTGTALGTGTILLKLESDAVRQTSWDGGAEKKITKGKSETFWASIYFADGVTPNKNFDATVIADAGGLGRDTKEMFTIYLAGTDNTEMHTLTVNAVQDGTTTEVSTAPIYIGAEKISSGTATKTLPEGKYLVYSEDVEGWYTPNDKEHPLTVSLTSDKTVTLEFTTEPPTEWPTWLIVAMVFAGIIGVGLIILILREVGIEITGNQIVALVIVVVMAVIAYYMIDAFDRLIGLFEGS